MFTLGKARGESKKYKRHVEVPTHSFMKHSPLNFNLEPQNWFRTNSKSHGGSFPVSLLYLSQNIGIVYLIMLSCSWNIYPNLEEAKCRKWSKTVQQHYLTSEMNNHHIVFTNVWQVIHNFHKHLHNWPFNNWHVLPNPKFHLLARYFPQGIIDYRSEIWFRNNEW